MNDMKENRELWNELEGAVEELVKQFAAASPVECDNENELINLAYEKGVIPEIRDRIVEFLESIGMPIPIVEGNY